MDTLEQFARYRPDVATLTDAEVDALWATIIGQRHADDGTSTTPEVADLLPAVSRTSRRVVISLVAAAAVVATVAGLVVVARDSRSDPPPPAVAGDLEHDGGWTSFPHPPIEPRFQYAAVSTGSGIFVWGGCCANGTGDEPYTDGAYYDGKTGTWAVLPEAPLDPTRGDARAVWTGSEIMVLNGIDGVHAAAFDPATFTWRTIPAPDADAAGGGLFRMDDGRVARLHGLAVDLWDPETETWSNPVADLSYAPTEEMLITGYSATGTSIGAITVDSFDDCSTVAIRLFDTTVGKWSSAPLQTTDWLPTSIVGMGDGRFLLSGRGSCDTPEQPSLAMVLDPTTGNFAPTDGPPESVFFPSGDGIWRGGVWTGDAVVHLSSYGRLVSYRPTTGKWSVGGSSLLEAAGRGDLVEGIPLVWFDGRVVIVSSNFGHLTPEAGLGSWRCCEPGASAWASSAPTAIVDPEPPTVQPRATVTEGSEPSDEPTSVEGHVSTEPAVLFQGIAIGDMVMLGAAEALHDRGFIVDASVSRQFVDGVELIEELGRQGGLGDHVIVHLGTNGTISAGEVDRLMATVADVPRVFVLTLHGDRSWIEGNNELIRSLADRPNVTVIDWERTVDSCQGDCFAADGIHLAVDGQRFYADLVVQAVRAGNGVSAVPGTVLVANANGIAGSAGALTRTLELNGYSVVEPTMADVEQLPLETSVVYARPGHEVLAVQLVRGLQSGTWEPWPADDTGLVENDDVEGVDVLILLGRDSVWASLAEQGCTVHIVEQGDTPYSVAEQFGVDFESLAAVNPLVIRTFLVGQPLLIGCSNGTAPD